MYNDDATFIVPTFGPGTFFADRYRVEALLGTGAMGRVYAATDMHTGRRVALKVLHRERLGEAETVERFRREAEVLASIGHPCIVEVHAFHRAQDGTPYLAMELLEGVTLKTRLANAGRFEDPREFQEILECIGSALDTAHARGVVHRDLKPDNVFLPATGDPRAKLVDFGLSRMAAERKDLTQSGMMLGTPRYMAPEQIRDAASAGPPVDMYSLGILTYESLAGRSPYPGQDYGQLIGCVLDGRTTPFETLRPDLPLRLAEVLARAMHRDPAARYVSCARFADAFAQAIGSPSKRPAFGPRTLPQHAPMRMSNQALAATSGSTLAFDASAIESLPDTRELAPMLAQASAASSSEATPSFQAARPSTSSVGSREPSPGPAAPAVPFASRSEHASPFASTTAAALGFAGDGYSGAGISGADAASTAAGPATVVLPNAAGLAGAALQPRSPSDPAPLPTSPSLRVGPDPSEPTASTRSARAGRGVTLFLVAMVVVIVLSAAIGYGLRAYMTRSSAGSPPPSDAPASSP
jgi:serine/threonine-protein kinase